MFARLSLKISMWMKATSSERSRLTCSAMSTTGPQTRLWQRAGVAKSSTTGSLPSTSARSSSCIVPGGIRVSISWMLATSSTVGVWTRGACSPARGPGPSRRRGCSACARRRISPSLLDHRQHPPLAGLIELQVGDVDGLRGVGIVGGVLRGERGLGLEALDPRRKRTLGLAVGTGRGVDRDLGVGDLLAVDGEDAEAEAVAALGQHLARRGDDEVVAWRRVGGELLERSALRRGKRGGLRCGRRGLVGGLVVAATAGGDQVRAALVARAIRATVRNRCRRTGGRLARAANGVLSDPRGRVRARSDRRRSRWRNVRR